MQANDIKSRRKLCNLKDQQEIAFVKNDYMWFSFQQS